MGINEGHKNILHIALPAIVSNITVPLLGLVDVAIVGHLGAPAYIGAIAVGGMLFNIFYWIFAFLRMGTSGMTSQAYGRRDLDEITRLLVRSVGVGFSVAIALIVFQYPLCIPLYRGHARSRAAGHALFPYMHLGCSCCSWSLCLFGLVYRYAEFPVSHVDCHCPKYCQHSSKSSVGFCFRVESRRSRFGHAYGTICRVRYGRMVLAALL